ncbi:hypothetical protein E4U56_001003 [Claviceps arundinis]|uniref:Uncharacterized protein n=1 Tax=Claviceps arundinis TaxID=1623583 RepID=A0A9P7MS42_9HYPO|nr:hypothetical protein E4U56_001003 [Claviceps arundinis]
MKLSTVLGTFALSTLEAYRAHASPLEPDTRSLSLEGGDTTEHCCVGFTIGDQRRAKYVDYPKRDLIAVVDSDGDCLLLAFQTSTPPSQGGCATWDFVAQSCTAAQNATAWWEPFGVCLLD